MFLFENLFIPILLKQHVVFDPYRQLKLVVFKTSPDIELAYLKNVTVKECRGAKKKHLNKSRRLVERMERNCIHF